MEFIKNHLRTWLRPLLEIGRVKRMLIRRLLFNNFREDARLFEKYALAFNNNELKNKEADLILNYHSLEKGMLFQEMNKGFGAYRVKNMHRLLNDPMLILNVNRSQIQVGYQVMCQYYELHQKLAHNIDDMYSKEQYDFYKSVLSGVYSSDFKGVVNWTRTLFYKNSGANFEQFAHSRKSVRDFTGARISVDVIKMAVELANTSPSVCNRQASNVYLIQDKQRINRILEIQGGFTGYAKNVSQLLVVTNDRRYYYTIGERSQLFIDGGIFLMNLLYALHYYQIGNCPANWGKTIKEEAPIDQVITIPKSEKIICIVPVGVVKPEFRTTLSKRRPQTENLFVLD